MQEKKKILILAMSCRDSFFENQISSIKETYASEMPDNVTFMYYDGCWANTKHVGDHLMLRCEDDLEHTFKKTRMALKYVMTNDDIEFDYILRVNTSTYVNVRLLDEFVQTLQRDDILWGSDLYSLSEANCPAPLDIYARGNAMLMSRKIAAIIINEGISFNYLNVVDDIAIGNILNSYYIKQSYNYNDYLQHIKGMPHGWYKCTSIIADNGHRLCTYGEYDALYNKFITTQIKSYADRKLESQHYKELHELVMSMPVDSEDVDFIYKYSENPSIFLGSRIGYVDLHTWLGFDHGKLFDFEITHKADNDPESKRKYNKRWDPN